MYESKVKQNEFLVKDLDKSEYAHYADFTSRCKYQ